MKAVPTDVGRDSQPVEGSPQRPSILFIDAYDSFTNNIISLLTTTLHCSVRVLHIDTPLFPTATSLADELRQYDAVVLGPGPGNPNIEADVGLMNRIWAASGNPKYEDESNQGTKVDIPILGICLGFQSLALQCGEEVRRLEGGGMHGLVRRVRHCRHDIYKGVSEVDATLYQSLCVNAGQDDIEDEHWENGMRWDVGSAGLLKPLAWVEENVEGRDRRIMVAARHVTMPWWGLQYHPESICTNQESAKVILNWMKEVNKHNRTTERKIVKDAQRNADMPVKTSLLARVEKRKMEMNGSMPSYEILDEDLDYIYETKVIDLPCTVEIPDIITYMQAGDRDMIVLESTNHNINGTGTESVRGRYSIVALNADKTVRAEYCVGSTYATLRPPNKRSHPVQVALGAYGGIWPFLASYLDRRRISGGNPDIPFWGGFMGYTTYELGLEGIDVAFHSTPQKGGLTRPDLGFAWITHSIVIDHQEKKVHLQQLIPSGTRDSAAVPWWLRGRGSQLVQFLDDALSSLPSLPFRPEEFALPVTGAMVRTLQPSAYEAAVRTCQSHISAGESYELCLTSLSTLTLPLPKAPTLGSRRLSEGSTLATSAWSIYTSLRAAQPAPFASFIRLGPATFLSCSPERFLKWSSSGRCELRPMKGTVKKSDAPSREEAERLLGVEKEKAENLMIVDLVRHDLYGVCGAGNVRVERLMGIEEYESVWQMVSAVVGDIPGGDCNVTGGEAAEAGELPATVEGKGKEESMGYSGVDVLAASLPPGSMTGAPKKRSCEVLNEIEHGRRSLYSGVVGYMDVGGRGDWSVNIRCAFRWDDESAVSENDTWYIGAGGAVTALSDPTAEREEMETKLFNTLNGFGLGLNLGKQ